MKFYDIDNALDEAIQAADKPVRLRIEINIDGHFETVFEQDIIEANFYSLKEAAGGVSSRGEILLDNSHGAYSFYKVSTGSQVKVSFSLGEGLPYFQRFNFFIDDKGIQDIRGAGRKKVVRIGLVDLSAKLRKTDEARDWTSPAVFTYSVVCDKTQPEKSLVHGIAQRAGLSATDIDCATIPVELPYIRLRRNTWAELSRLASAYRCHLECATEKPLVFAHSPYQTEALMENDVSYTFSGKDIFYMRKIDRSELYRNTVRLKFNLPVALEKQEIWRYDDPPVFYDDFLQPFYPFKYPLVREIENGNYEAKYKVIDDKGKERNVVFADDIDTQGEAENRLEYVSSGDADGGTFSYSQYDVTTHCDRAILKLQKENDGDLYNASIFGKPIVLDLNRSCFLKDTEGINNFGTVALNVTGSYFSEHDIDGRPQYEDWVVRELTERLKSRREFTVKTHRALFNSRVGANVQVITNRYSNQRFAVTGAINALSFRYKRDRAFIASFKFIEQGVSVNEEK